MKIAVVLITYNRVKDAKVNQEIMRNIWPKSEMLKKVDIYHAFNGKKEWYPSRYLEDYLIYRPAKDHFFGAADLIDSAFAKVFSSNIKYDYIVVLSADTFLVNPKYLEDTIKTINLNNIKLATSLWYSTFFVPHFFSTECFIVSFDLAKKVFPLSLEEYYSHKPFTSFIYELTCFIPVVTVPLVELCFTKKVSAILNDPRRDIYFFKDRKIVWFANRFCSKKMGYYSHHDLDKKLSLIKKSSN